MIVFCVGALTLILIAGVLNEVSIAQDISDRYPGSKER